MPGVAGGAGSRMPGFSLPVQGPAWPSSRCAWGGSGFWLNTPHPPILGAHPEQGISKPGSGRRKGLLRLLPRAHPARRARGGRSPVLVWAWPPAPKTSPEGKGHLCLAGLVGGAYACVSVCGGGVMRVISQLPPSTKERKPQSLHSSPLGSAGTGQGRPCPGEHLSGPGCGVTGKGGRSPGSPGRRHQATVVLFVMEV